MVKKLKITEITEEGLYLFAEQMQFIKKVISKKYPNLDIVKINFYTNGEISVGYDNGTYCGKPNIEYFRIPFEKFMEMQREVQKKK